MSGWRKVTDPDEDDGFFQLSDGNIEADDSYSSESDNQNGPNRPAHRPYQGQPPRNRGSTRHSAYWKKREGGAGPILRANASDFVPMWAGLDPAAKDFVRTIQIPGGLNAAAEDFCPGGEGEWE